MNLYHLMKDYAEGKNIPHDSSMPTPELGNGLSLFHASLVESGMLHEGTDDKPRLSDSPEELTCSHLSHFIVAFLPFNSIINKEEINAVLFEVYSFLKWLEKRDITHGLIRLDLMRLIKDLSSMQERCLRLSHLLDDVSGATLDNPPEIVGTINDVFSVVKIEKDFIHLKGRRHDDVVRLRLPENILPLVKLKDSLDLVLGDTSEKWVVLEAGQVYPAYSQKKSAV